MAVARHRCIVLLVIAFFLGIISGSACLIGRIVRDRSAVRSSKPGSLRHRKSLDPINGLVPPGYGNSTSTTTIIPTEFAFLNGGGTVADPGIDSVTASFSDSTLVVSETINYSGPLSGFRTVFTDSAFTGLSVAKTFDKYAMGGMS